ncbi:MAG: 4-(cytidine 5'-diphospho)-2-C-methyl-D-erythritol kinase, partial [Verrucomicrobia bacterium]
MEEVAPAKINLSLQVLRRHDDGFHQIETRMAPISLYDSLQVEPADAFEFRADDPTLPMGEDNLVVRAADLFFSQIKREPKVRLILIKKIPHGAGLGGGSSDAAATLRLLNRFFDAKLPMEELSA